MGLFSVVFFVLSMKRISLSSFGLNPIWAAKSFDF